MDKIILNPLLKWAGGKRKLLNEIIPRIPQTYNTYFEPFAGGGAVFLAIKPTKGYINDLNEELINVYLTVKNEHLLLIDKLVEHEEMHDKEHYYDVRSMDRDGRLEELNNVEKAARIIYLNHTCYNGLFRVNSKGQYNTPMGRYKNPKILDIINITNVHNYFLNSKLKFSVGDYTNILKKAKKGDFVYLDPPYDPVSDSGAFTMYTKSGFNRDDQIKLKECCDKLNKKGIKFLQSNSDTEFIRDLYKDYKIEIVQMPRMINSKGNSRSNINEVLISNY